MTSQLCGLCGQLASHPMELLPQARHFALGAPQLVPQRLGLAVDLGLLGLGPSRVYFQLRSKIRHLREGQWREF